MRIASERGPTEYLMVSLVRSDSEGPLAAYPSSIFALLGRSFRRHFKGSRLRSVKSEECRHATSISSSRRTWRSWPRWRLAFALASGVRSSFSICRCPSTAPRTRPRKVEFAMDSPLEGDGFEPSVPSQRGSGRAAPVRLRWSPQQCPGCSSEVVAPGAGRGGTASSNPLCSSGESANPWSLGCGPIQPGGRDKR
jgi:hypothetical protein